MKKQQANYDRLTRDLNPDTDQQLLKRFSHCLRPTLGGARTTALPAFAHYFNIVETCSTSTVTMITGSTGCGKSTQVPLYLATEATQRKKSARIVCTQPSSFAAFLLASRVKAEWAVGSSDADAAKHIVSPSEDSELTDYKTISFVDEGVFLDHVLKKYLHLSCLCSFDH